MALQIAYVALGLLVTVLLIVIVFRATPSNSESQGKSRLLLIGGILLWHVYLYWLSGTGILADFSFPPKFFLFMILPAFIFTGLFLYRNRNSKWVTEIPKSWIIHAQVYRMLIETLFVYSVAASILPPQVTIEGYNFDMIFAFTAPLVGFLTFKTKMLPTRFLVYWNYLGLLIIASIIGLFLSSIYAPHIFEGGETVSVAFTEYPYVLVPGYLMPAAVFLHVLSIIQLTRKS